MLTFWERGLLINKSSVPESSSYQTRSILWPRAAPPDSLESPLCIEEGGQQGEAAKKQQEAPQAKERLLIPMYLATQYLEEREDKMVEVVCIFRRARKLFLGWCHSKWYRKSHWNRMKPSVSTRGELLFNLCRKSGFHARSTLKKWAYSDFWLIKACV
jgi:hypothetical protein